MFKISIYILDFLLYFNKAIHNSYELCTNSIKKGKLQTPFILCVNDIILDYLENNIYSIIHFSIFIMSTRSRFYFLIHILSSIFLSIIFKIYIEYRSGRLYSAGMRVLFYTFDLNFYFFAFIPFSFFLIYI